LADIYVFGDKCRMSFKALIYLAFLSQRVSPCTIIAVGKIAGGGSVYLGHTDDAGDDTVIR